MPVWPRLLIPTVSAVVLFSCGDASGPNQRPVPQPLPLTLGLKETFLSPRDIQRVAVTVHPTPGDSIEAAYFRFSGNVFRDSMPLPMGGDQPQIGYVDFTVPVAPLSGTVYVTAIVRTAKRQGTADTVFTIGDDGIPIVGITPPPSTVAPGDTLPIYCSGWDRSGILNAQLQVTGAADTAFQTADPAYPQSYFIYGGAAVPAAAAPGSALALKCTLTDIYGHSVTDSATVAVTAGP